MCQRQGAFPGLLCCPLGPALEAGGQQSFAGALLAVSMLLERSGSGEVMWVLDSKPAATVGACCARPCPQVGMVRSPPVWSPHCSGGGVQKGGNKKIQAFET